MEIFIRVYRRFGVQRGGKNIRNISNTLFNLHLMLEIRVKLMKTKD